MSNVWLLKGLLWFTAGAGIASVITYHVCDKRFEKNLRDIDAELIAKEHDEAAKKLSKELEESEKELTETKTPKNDIPKSAEHYTQYYKANKGEAMNKEYFDDNTFRGDVEQDDPFDSGGELGPLDDEPYVISEPEYISNDNYEKSYIKWYSKDNTFVGEDENVLDEKDVFGMIGDTATRRFGEESNDEDVVYIRNEGMMTDFEVDRVNGRYSS